MCVRVFRYNRAKTTTAENTPALLPALEGALKRSSERPRRALGEPGLPEVEVLEPDDLAARRHRASQDMTVSPTLHRSFSPPSPPSLSLLSSSPRLSLSPLLSRRPVSSHGRAACNQRRATEMSAHTSGGLADMSQNARVRSLTVITSSTWWPSGPVSVLRRMLPTGAPATCAAAGRHARSVRGAWTDKVTNPHD